MDKQLHQSVKKKVIEKVTQFGYVELPEHHKWKFLQTHKYPLSKTSFNKRTKPVVMMPG